MAWGLRPSIAGTAGLFLALILATSSAHAEAHPNQSKSAPLDVVQGQ
jgi:hypothetical protein